VLDIACGTGYAAPLFMNANAEAYTGVDLGEKQINYATAKYGTDRVQYSVGDICKFHAHDHYDLIVCFETIEHVSDYKGALNNLYKLLDKDGTLIVSSPNRPITSPEATTLQERPANPFHTQEFTPDELRSALVEAGFKVQRTVYGQRQRHVFSGPRLNRLREKIFGDANHKSSPKDEPARFKTPRYFLLVATK
jgi:2-polyprenyl-3-methyl-5-hydroxy-6-metoxy-1,4-benzoquinol methylase